MTQRVARVRLRRLILAVYLVAGLSRAAADASSLSGGIHHRRVGPSAVQPGRRRLRVVHENRRRRDLGGGTVLGRRRRRQQTVFDKRLWLRTTAAMRPE